VSGAKIPERFIRDILYDALFAIHEEVLRPRGKSVVSGAGEAYDVRIRKQEEAALFTKAETDRLETFSRYNVIRNINLQGETT